jgi:hypothetical protein
MFSDLRQNSIIYVFDKGNKPSLKIAQVVNTSSMQPVIGQINSYTVDITAKIDGKDVVLKQLPASLSLANSDGLVVSDSKELMANEIENTKKASQHILDTIDYHKTMVSACDEFLVEINPQLAQQKEQEKKITALENKMGNIEDSLSTIQALLQKSLNTNKERK